METVSEHRRQQPPNRTSPTRKVYGSENGSPKRSKETFDSDFNGYKYQDLVSFESDLDQSIFHILGASNAMDTNDFPIVDYLNATFPTGILRLSFADKVENVLTGAEQTTWGQSLAHADKVLVNLKTQVKLLDRELKTLMRSSANQNPNDDKEIEQEIIQVKLAMEVGTGCMMISMKTQSWLSL